MAKILILGAGSMGTAFSFPCSDKNHAVTIIGTHLENDFINQIGCEFTALNIEAFPTYILSKDTSSEAYASFVTHAIRHLELVAKIGDVTKKNTSKRLPNFLMEPHAFSQFLNNVFVF